MALVLKTKVGKTTVGSNPTASAHTKENQMDFLYWLFIADYKWIIWTVIIVGGLWSSNNYQGE